MSTRAVQKIFSLKPTLRSGTLISGRILAKGLNRLRNLPAIGYGYSPFCWDGVRIFPPAFFIFCSAVWEHDGTMIVRGFVIFPVPRSLV